MQAHPIAPSEMAKSFIRNRSLTWALIKREVVGRYRGSTLGLLWSLFNPIFMLVIYTFVFSVVFKARWSVDSSSKTEFALMLFAGLMIFNLFSECINRAPSLIISNTNYVKKVVFPLEILSWVAMGSGFFHFLVSLVVWLAAYMILFGELHLTALLLPVVLAPLLLLTLGLVWFLASLGAYLRDVSQIISVLTSVLMFMSPIFYPVTSLPEKYWVYMNSNPLTPPIENARKVLFRGELPDFSALAIYYAVAILIFWLGFAWFQKTRKGFADVL
ncbi:ABC transporter permease [Pseudomonas graminis]|jgi:lipopolysaccharide transport system permease protein|uniref:Transport permease protein n=1 Tax=Pseudomonas graminis TaxID=158627 RepID=A0A1I0ISA2_9PSED|nr:ABC transporter permease [Pseudomonas graminis]SEU00132.1 lipopolysaccharide transport system permease protein [Pseudomonas graminis]